MADVPYPSYPRQAAGMTRVYHLLAKEWALDDLDRRRLKIARFDDLNDPFELLAVEPHVPLPLRPIFSHLVNKLFNIRYLYPFLFLAYIPILFNP